MILRSIVQILTSVVICYSTASKCARSTLWLLDWQSNSEVEFIPPGLTGDSQPMDIAVMKQFKDNLRSLYVQRL